MNRKKWRILFLVLSCAFLAFYVGIWKNYDTVIFLDIKVCRDNEIEVHLIEQSMFGRGQEVVLADEEAHVIDVSWQDTYGEMGKCLFLPDYLDLSKVYVRYSHEEEAAAELLLDEVLLQEDRICEFGALNEGAHQITLGDEVLAFHVIKGSSLASLWIETDESMDYVHENQENTSAGEIKIISANGTESYAGEMESIKGRGNSSWYMLKKSYGIKLATQDSLLGMTPGKSWVLLSGALDATALRNKIFLDMAQECGLDNAVESEWVDLYINGTYYGCYLLTEKITVATGRLEIGDLEEKTALINEQPLETYPRFESNEGGLRKGYLIPNNPDNITGGYLLEMETYGQRFSWESSCFTTENGTPIIVKEPDYISAEQVQYISSFVQNFEDALYSESGYNALGQSYLDYIDLESFCLRYLVDEISKNIDAGYSSYFFYKPQGESKMYAGPVWDYDTALGNNNGWGDSAVLTDPEGMYVNRANWSAVLWEKEEFAASSKELFEERFLPWLEELTETGLDEYIDTIYKSVKMEQIYQGKNDLDGEIELLKTFLRERKDYLKDVLTVE